MGYYYSGHSGGGTRSLDYGSYGDFFQGACIFLSTAVK